MQKKKKLKQQLEREIQEDECNIRAARAIASRPIGRPSNDLHMEDVVQPAPQLHNVNRKVNKAKRKIGKAKKPVRKKQKRSGKIRDEKPKGVSPLLRFGFRRKV